MDSEFETIEKLQAQIGREAVVTLLKQHRRNVAETMAKLNALEYPQDKDEIRMIAHRLRGGCGSMGFKRLSAVLEQLYRAAERDDGGAVKRHEEEAQAENARIAEAVAQRYPEI